MYLNINLIRSHMREIRTVNHYDVFKLYKETSGEYNKWLIQHGEEMAVKHFKIWEEKFEDLQWQQGIIKIHDLYPVSMCIGLEWIKKLACSKTDCINHLQDECANCIDFNESKTPTLRKLVANYHLNTDSIFTREIESIKKSLLLRELNEDKIFIIIVDDNPPYIFDGNKRLISLATLDSADNMFINCYLGEHIGLSK